MTPQEEYNLAQFLRCYVECRFELMAHNAARRFKNLDFDSLGSDAHVNFNWSVTIQASMMKLIMSGELSPELAVKMIAQSDEPMPRNVRHVDLDREP